MVEEIDTVTGMVWDLANEKEIQASHRAHLRARERGGRPLQHRDRRPLQVGQTNPIEIMKWKEIYHGLEDACDDCKDYTHVLGNIVVKNA